MFYLRLRTSSYAVPDLKLHNCAKITNTEMYLKPSGLVTSPSTTPWALQNEREMRFFQHWPVLLPLAIVSPLFSPLAVFVPSAESSLGQGQCLIAGRTLSKASHPIAVEYIT